MSSEFDFTLSRVHRADFFQLQIRKKKRDILSEKRESGMALKKREFTPESGSVDTYDIYNSFGDISKYVLFGDISNSFEDIFK